MNQNKTGSSVPLAKVLTTSDWKGALAKYIEIPPGRTGVVIYPDGRSKTLASGRQQILGLEERIRGQGAGLQAGYLSEGPFTAGVLSEYVLSNEGVLMDVLILLRVTVADAVKFFTAQVLPQGEISEIQPHIGGELFQRALMDLTRRYTAIDLVHGLPADRLAYELRQRLDALLANQGLMLGDVHSLSFTCSGDRAEIASQAAELESRLNEIEMDGRMMEAETRQKLDDFMQQVEPGLVRPLAGAEGSPQTVESGLKARVDSVKSWLSWKKKDAEEKPHWKLASVLQPTANEPVSPIASRSMHVPRNWWLGRTLWILSILFLTVALTWITAYYGKKASWNLTFGVVTTYWIIAIPLVFESLNNMVKKREQMAEKAWLFPGVAHIDDLVRKDRPAADRLVRGQVALEFQRIVTVLSDIRSRIFKGGDTPLALKIRDLEQKTGAYREQIQSPAFGAPVYLDKSIHIDRSAWDKMLDYDEKLLYYASGLSEKAAMLQQKFPAEGLVEEGLQDLEGQLDSFNHLFAGRARSIQIVS